MVPDNVLFESGAAAVVRRRLLESCRLHSLLRLPSGLFYAQGVKANILFFDRRGGPNGPGPSEQVWIYELLAARRYSVKTNPLQRKDLNEFVSLYHSRALHKGAMRTPVSKLSVSRAYRVVDILNSDECLLDMASADEFRTERQPGPARLDELTRLVAEDLQHALSLITKPFND